MLHTPSYFNLLFSGNLRQHSRTQTIKLNEACMERDGDKQEVLQQICCGCFFFLTHSKSVGKIFMRNNKPAQEHKIYKDISGICIFSFKMYQYVSDSCLSHFLSLLDRRFVFPVQLVTDTTFACDYKCYSTQQRQKNKSWMTGIM